jgi:hypothetical protein
VHLVARADGDLLARRHAAGADMDEVAAQALEFLYFQNNPFTEEGKMAIFNACRGKIRCHLGWPPPLGMLNPEDWDV